MTKQCTRGKHINDRPGRTYCSKCAKLRAQQRKGNRSKCKHKRHDYPDRYGRKD